MAGISRAGVRASVLTLLIAIGGLVAGCSRSDPASPCPTPDGSVRLDDGTALPVCDALVEVTAIGEAWNLIVQGTLPDARRFGEDQGRVGLSVFGYTGPGTYAVAGPSIGDEGPATGRPAHRLTIGTSDSSIGIAGTRASGPLWSGTCSIDIGPPGGRVAGQCELTSEGRDPIAATIDLPAPALVPSWLEAEYEIDGSYAASARLRLAAPSDDAMMLVIPLPDGSSLRIVPRGERPVFLDTVPAGSPQIVDHRPTPENGLQPFDPSFGTCLIELDQTWIGSVTCPGDADHPAGSVTLALVTRLP